MSDCFAVTQNLFIKVESAYSTSFHKQESTLDCVNGYICV